MKDKEIQGIISFNWYWFTGLIIAVAGYLGEDVGFMILGMVCMLVAIFVIPRVYKNKKSK